MNTNYLAKYIRANDYQGYIDHRYPEIQDGDNLVFKDQDFSDTDFSKFPMGFATFRNCTLDHAKALHGQPIILESCSAQNLDLQDVTATIQATDSNLTHLQFNKRTALARPENGVGGRSTFIRCTIDTIAREHFLKQGAVFKN